MKTDKLFNATYSCLIGISLMFLGIITLLGRKWLYVNVVNVLLLAIFILSLKHFLNYFIGKQKDKKVNFTSSFLGLIFCFVFSLFRNIPLSILPLIFGLYLLLNALIKFINGFIFIESGANGKLTEFGLGIVYLAIAVPILFSPIKNIDVVLVILGIYILLLGIDYLFDFIFFIIPTHITNELRKYVRIHLPAIVEAIIPFAVLNEINYLINKDSYDKPFVFEEKEDGVEPNIEVFVHISNRGFNRVGHVDLCYNDKVISYGGYDDASQRFFTTIGDGVLYTADREKYIPFCIEHSKKTIFAFGLKLTEKQKKNIDKTIENLFLELHPWYPPIVVANNEKKKVKDDDYKDFASCLYKTTKAKFYKFSRGRFKKFFVVGSNCCRLADSIIRKSGIDVKMYGIITPGTYYEYLNREFQKKNSIVVSRKIYNNKSVDKKTIQEIFKGFSK